MIENTFYEALGVYLAVVKYTPGQPPRVTTTIKDDLDAQALCRVNLQVNIVKNQLKQSFLQNPLLALVPVTVPIAAPDFHALATADPTRAIPIGRAVVPVKR